MKAPFHYKRGRSFGAGRGWQGYSVRDADEKHVATVKEEADAVELIELLTLGHQARITKSAAYVAAQEIA